MIFQFRDTPLVNVFTNTPIRRQPRPLIPLRVAGPNGLLVPIIALVDTGADEVMLPDSLPPRLGFVPGSGVARGTTGIGGRAGVVYHPVRLELRTAPNDRLIWEATVGFGRLPIHIALFGVAGGLEFFHVGVNVVDRQVTLFPHSMMPLLPASVTPHVAFPVP